MSLPGSTVILSEKNTVRQNHKNAADFIKVAIPSNVSVYAY
jgi:hypothetical protein